MSFLDRFKSQMIPVDIYRNNVKISTEKCLKDSSLRTFKFYPNVDIMVDDVVLEPITKMEFLIIDIDTKSFQGQITEKVAYYETKTSHAHPASTTVFNIQNADHSIIGNQQNATINLNNIDMDKFLSLIEEKGANDKELLRELAETLKDIKNNNVPVKHGMLSKFSDVLCKYSWAFETCSNLIVAWLVNR